MKTTKEVRTAAGYSQTEAAAMARVSPNTWRLFEGAPAAVTEAKRRACEAAVARMRELGPRVSGKVARAG